MGSVKLTQKEAESVPMLAELLGLDPNGEMGLNCLRQLMELVGVDQAGMNQIS